MVYLLIMRPRTGTPPEKVISTLFLSLLVTVAGSKMFLRLRCCLPLRLYQEMAWALASEKARIGRHWSPQWPPYSVTVHRSTCWKPINVLLETSGSQLMTSSKRRWPSSTCAWPRLSICSTKGSVCLDDAWRFVLVLVLKLSLPNLIGGVLLFTIVIVLFASTGYGRPAHQSANTPLLKSEY